MRLFNYLIFLPLYIDSDSLRIVFSNVGFNGIPIGAIVLALYILFSINKENINRAVGNMLYKHAENTIIFAIVFLISIISAFLTDYRIFQLIFFILLSPFMLFLLCYE